jgi:hypothetical protein
VSDDDKPKYKMLNAEGMRDLELILLGAAFVKGEVRERILGALPKGTIAGEVGELLEAIRDQDAKPISRWLDDRACAWDKSHDFIQAVVNCVVEVNQRQLIAETFKGLAFLAATAPLIETKGRAAKFLQTILEMP